MTNVEQQRKERERRAQLQIEADRAERKIRDDRERIRQNKDVERRRIQLMAIRQQEEKKEAEISSGELKSKQLVKELEEKKRLRLLEEQQENQP
jgi:hypothetical protein